MSDQVVLYVDRLMRPSSLIEEEDRVGDAGGASADNAGPSCSAASTKDVEVKKRDEVDDDSSDDEEDDESEPLINGGECRICQDEDLIRNLESPCACSGSLKYAHRKCVQHWCNEKGDTTCEICHQQYQPNYTAPSPRSDDTAIDIGGGWTLSGTPLDLHDPRLLAIAEAERQFLETEYDEYAASSATGAAFCRSAALILMALLLLRHALTVPDGDNDGDDDVSTFFSLFLLRAAGFLLPCYIMAWAITILQRRRQRQEAAALAATQVAFVLQSGQRRGVQFAIATSPTVAGQQQQQQETV